MINSLVFFLYCILFFISSYKIIKQYKRKQLIDGFLCFQVAFLLYYIMIPIISLIMIFYFPNQLVGFVYRISKVDSHDLVYAFIYTLIMYLTLFFYNVRISKKSVKIELREIKSDQISCLNKKKYRILITIGLILLMVGLTSELIIADSLGGIFKAVSMGDKLRAFGSDSSQYIPRNRLFLKILMATPLASTYLFVYALRIYNRFTPKLLLFVSILASVFFLTINAGRLPILLYILPFFLDLVFRKSKHPFILLAFFSLFILVILGDLDNLFFYLSYGYVKESSTSIVSIINEFSFPYLNLLNVHKINEKYGLRWGLDFVTWIINVVPTSLLKVFGLSKVVTGYSFITEYYRSGNASGGIPTDFITLLIRQFGPIGIIIGGLIITRLCKYMDRVIYKIYSKRYIFFTIRISLIMFTVVPYSDLDSFIRNRYDMLIVYLVAVIFANKYREPPVVGYLSKSFPKAFSRR